MKKNYNELIEGLFIVLLGLAFWYVILHFINKYW